MKKLINTIKSLFCRHEYEMVNIGNVYISMDEMSMVKVSVCQKCGKKKVTII